MSGSVWYLSVSRKKIEFKKYPKKKKRQPVFNKKGNKIKGLLINILFFSAIILFSSFISAETINDTFHINVQTTFSNGTIQSGTFAFAFNITGSSDSSCLGPIVYNHSTSQATDTRGIVSIYLPTIGSGGGNLSSLSFDKQYYLCYYRDGTLKDVSQLGRVPYSFRATQVNLSEVSIDSNLTLGSFNVSASSGFFTFLGSLASRISKIFATDADISNNLVVGRNLTVSNGTLFVNNNTGRVGINTISPAEALDIIGTIQATGPFQTTGNEIIYAGSPLGQVKFFRPSTTNDIALYAGGLERVRINGSQGNVGINITNPQNILHVFGDANITGATYLLNSKCASGEVLTANTTTGLVSCVTDQTGAGSFDLNITSGDGSGVITDSEIFNITGNGTANIRTYMIGNDLVIEGTDTNSGGTITGSGTSGRIARFNGTTSINNSVIFENGSSIGINTTIPGTAALNVSGLIFGSNGLTISAGTVSLPGGEIGAFEIAASAINTTHILDNTILAGDIAFNQINASHILASAINTTHILDATIGAIDIAASAINTTHILDGTVGNIDLANSSLTVTAGSGLTGGGSVSLGGTTTLSVNFGTDFLGWTNLTQYPTGCGSGQAVQVIGDTLTCVNLNSTGNVTGTGTANNLTKWTGTSTIGNSIIYDNGTNIGIGNITPDKKLVVQLSDAAGVDEFKILDSAGATIFTIDSDGNTLWVNTIPTINFNNANTINFNDIDISDPGAGEGLGWSGTAANWIIDVTNATRANIDGDLWLYGTANNVRVARPFIVQNGTGTGNFTAIYADTVLGKVGINTTSPQNTLNVIGDANITGLLRFGSLPASSINATYIAASSINTTHILDATIGAIDLAASSVNTTHILDNTILAGDIAASAINTTHILDGTVGNIDLANSSLTVTAGSGLTGGGSVSLGGTTTLSVNFGTDFLGWTNLTQYPTGCGSGQAVQVIGDTLTCVNLNSTGNVTGTGTANNLTKWTGTSTIGNSIIYDNGTNIGIGTTTPGAKLDVNLAANEIAKLGTAGIASGIWGTNIGFLSQNSEAQIVSGVSIPLVFKIGGTFNSMTSGTERARIDTSGNFSVDTNTLFVDAVNNRVGIGTTSPNSTFHVDAPSGQIILRPISSSAETTDNIGIEIRDSSGAYALGNYSNRLVKADESGGIPLYVQGNLNGDAVTWTNLARFGAYTANSNEFEVYGDINATEDIRASTGFFDTNSAGDPGGTGLFMAYAGSDPDSGPAIRWTDGTLGNTIGLYISGGLNWQGDVGGNPDFNVLQPTDTGALGTIRVHLDGDAAGDSYFNGGNVGIGTTTPAGGKLNVVGDGNFTGKVYFGELATNVLSLIEPIYIRGTGLNNNANRVLKISNTTIYDTTGRGLRLTVLWKANHSIVSDTTYDTYGLGTASDSLAADMNGMTNAQMGILTSNDAWENNVTANLDTAFGRKGLYKAQISPNSGSRRPYAAIFESASNNETSDKAAECLYDDTTNQSYCEIRGFLIDGSFTATGTTKNALTNTQGNLLAVVADENANVGIGTTSPQQKLNVVGTANFTGNTTSLTDFCIVGGNCLSTSGGTMSSFTLGASAGANQTINDGNTAFLVAGTGITTTAAATDMVTIAATLGTAIEKGELANSGTLSFDWVDSEVDDALTISGGTIGTNTISSGAAWNTAGTLTIGDAGDRIDISSSGWDVINSALSGATISGNTIALSTNTYTGTLGGANITADSIGDTQLAFNTGQHLTTASSPTFGGLTLNGNLNLSGKNITNVDHIDANSYDPPYTIAGERYATFLPGMSGGVKEEVTGTIMLNSNYVIDFKKLERGSDLWLFYQVTDFGEKMENLQVILTPSFDGRVWYTKDPVKKTITIHGSHSGEVSYRLTSNRYDWKSLVNYKPVSPGHIIPEEK